MAGMRATLDELRPKLEQAMVLRASLRQRHSDTPSGSEKQSIGQALVAAEANACKLAAAANEVQNGMRSDKVNTTAHQQLEELLACSPFSKKEQKSWSQQAIAHTNPEATRAVTRQLVARTPIRKKATQKRRSSD